MPALAAWLVALSWPIVARVLLALGIGTITYTGASAALTSLLSSAKGAMTGIIPEVSQLLAMAGFFEGFSIAAGALISGLVFMVMKRFALKAV